ncbi:M67 family peptidase [Brevibacillus fluminis]|uniref:M67 family peptidase n=1 Tax=Brevibacillus fluminis TaxID=511487 RepID=A0A3M8DCU5_9BACL|nr:M67 family metallopeptidase [Brevibacillus fluminis]RNB85836.1 M67 family peptidase [Brevibacillus fluminis]
MLSSIMGEPFTNKHTRLWMDRKVYERLLDAGQTARPKEFAALLGGTGAHITASFSPSQLATDRTSFHWDGPTLLSALREIGQSQLQWLGVFHTHPLTAPLPSSADHAGWHYPALSYWILSLAGREPELRAYQLTEGVFQPRSFMLVD